LGTCGRDQARNHTSTAQVALLSAKQVCLPNKCVCQTSVSAKQVCLPNKCVCQTSVSAKQVCLPNKCVQRTDRGCPTEAALQQVTPACCTCILWWQGMMAGPESHLVTGCW
jgi:hypothetical protein